MAQDSGVAPLPLKIAFLHPDLGIGGAERLVVDAALGLQARGHTVEIITSHHDPQHSFHETNDGSLRVTHVPSPVPRTILGKFHIYLAILRQLHLLLVLVVTVHWKKQRAPFDVYVVDQLAAIVPFLRWITGRRVVFYGHFPDKLLAGGKEAVVDGQKPKQSLLKTLYRGPPDWIEEHATGWSDVILVNSEFTSKVFRTTFSSIKKSLDVVYPGINIDAYETKLPKKESDDVAAIRSDRLTFISLNRFERKKNVALAIQAFSKLLSSRPEDNKTPRLVVGGGYDPRLQDNVQTLKHLISICEEQGLQYRVIANDTPLADVPTGTATEAPVTFILNFTTPQRQYLLRSPNTLALLYTPGNEHFGIGPVEGMISGLPVVAINSGGPVESLVDIRDHPKDGVAWLCPPEVDEWMKALQDILLLTPEERLSLSARAKERARSKFSMKGMCLGFEHALYRATAMGIVDDFPMGDILMAFAGVTIALLFLGFREKFGGDWRQALSNQVVQFGIMFSIFTVISRLLLSKLRR